MKEPIRVAQVMGKMVGGGVESVVMNYYRHIDRSRVQFDFLIDEDSTVVPDREILTLGGRLFVVPPYQRPIAYQRNLIDLFRENQWPIVHSHVNVLSVFPLRAAKKAGVPVRIAHAHSTAGRGELARNLMKSTLKRFSKVYPTDLVACGHYAGEWQFGKGSAFTLITNAIEVESFRFDNQARQRLREELGIPEESLLIGHLGRLVSQKNHSFLIKAFKRCLESDVPAFLALAGEGPLEGDLRELVRCLGISDRVLILGRREDAASLYSAFDLFALPSLYEGLCVVGIEAQASGLPCLFSDSVTREVGLSPSAQFLPLNERVWADAFIEFAHKHVSDRSSPRGIAGYDINSASKELASFYVSRASKRGSEWQK